MPTKPYFDQVAGALGLYLSIKGKKEVRVYCPTLMTVAFNRLLGVDKITDQIGSKNLEIRFADYNASNIEKVSYDIENGEFRLKVVPKAGFDSPKKDQVITNYSGVNADLVILIGGANDSHFPLITSPDLAKTNLAHIGTKALSISTGKQIMSFARPASSTSEVVANLIKENSLPMNADVATDLIAGIEEGSGHFEGSEVTANTFETFADLLKHGGRREQNQKLSPAAFPQGSIPQPSGQAPKQVSQAPKDWLEPKIFKSTLS